MVEAGLAEGPWSLTDHGRRAEVKLRSNPYDLEAWSVLVREAQTTSILRARILYERVVTNFPTSGRYWRLYVEQEMRQRNYEQVEKLFQRCLMVVLNIDLWKCYITYVRQTKSSLRTFREKMRQTYEFALDHIGIDYHSTSVWIDFISFLKSDDAQGSFAENQKVQSIRSAYQRAVVTPLMNIEQLWKEYNFFENTVDKINAKRNIEAFSRQYVNAKRSAQEYDNLSRGLIRGGTSIPLRGTPQELQQLQIWKRVISWERSNPTRTEEQVVLVKRVLYAYEQCLLCFGQCADIWYEAALYLQRASEAGNSQLSAQWAEEASIMYERASSGPLKNNLLLNFAHADFEESTKKFDKCQAIYDKLLEKRDVDPTLVYVQYMRYARRTEGIKSARNIFKRAREDLRAGHHIFVAAALMEYYTSKDKNIAFKIFELGLKRYGDDPNYVLAYIDHLSHLSDDNNTRVLFEKAISSMPQDKTSEIWEKFVEFESNVGDLDNVVKVERRRAATVKNDESRSKDAVLLVDRYKYINLMPCSDIELKLMGHPSYQKPPSGSATSASRRDEAGPHSSIGATKGGSSLALELRQASIINPDLKQMTAFKPSASKGVGMNAVPGGHFPIPAACANLLSRLPPPDCFHGPFVQMNELIHLLETNKTLDSVGSTLTGGDGVRVGKRRRGDAGEESEDEGATPPVNDIYRARQQKRVHPSFP